MKAVYIIFTDAEFKRLLISKRASKVANWHAFILQLNRRRKTK